MNTQTLIKDQKINEELLTVNLATYLGSSANFIESFEDPFVGIIAEELGFTKEYMNSLG